MINGNLPLNSQPQNKTTKYFNNFFTNDIFTTQNIDDATIAYFQSITGSKDTGINLAGAVLFTAKSRGVDPMALIDEFRKLRPNELNAYLTMFLNFNRAGTSLLGLNNSPQTSKYVTRAILA